MMSRPAFAVFVFAILFYPGTGRTDETRHSSYDECITDTLKGVSSDVAANAIITSCRNLFPEQVEVSPVQEETTPEPAGTTRSLTPEELGKLSATAFTIADTYRITFTNENEHLTVTEVTIAIGDDSEPDGLRRYSKKVRIAPLATGVAKYKVPYKSNGFELDTIEVSEPSWSVVAAEGID